MVVWVETKAVGCSQGLQRQGAAFVLSNLHGSLFFKVYFPSVLSLVFASRENACAGKAGDAAPASGRSGSRDGSPGTGSATVP